MKRKKIPGCPSCSSEVVVTEYRCPRCGITVRGEFAAGPLSVLSDEQVSIVAAFLASGGNIREMQERLDLSYPTVKSRLRDINRALGLEEPEDNPRRMEILAKLESGDIDVQSALEEIEKEKK